MDDNRLTHGRGGKLPVGDPPLPAALGTPEGKPLGATPSVPEIASPPPLPTSSSAVHLASFLSRRERHWDRYGDVLSRKWGLMPYEPSPMAVPLESVEGAPCLPVAPKSPPASPRVVPPALGAPLGASQGVSPAPPAPSPAPPPTAVQNLLRGRRQDQATYAHKTALTVAAANLQMAARSVGSSGEELVRQLDRFPGPTATAESVDLALSSLLAQENSDLLQRVLVAFPIFGQREALLLDPAEVPEEVARNPRLDLSETIHILKTGGLVLDHEGRFALTRVGARVVQALMDRSPAATALALDAQMATLATRLATDPWAAAPLLEASLFLLRDGLEALREGHPIRFGAVLRAIRNAVAMDLERPDSLLTTGGLHPGDLDALMALARQSPLAEGVAPPEWREFRVALAARDQLREAAHGDREALADLLLTEDSYAESRQNLIGLRAMAHFAWTHLARGMEDGPSLRALSLDLAHAVAGVPGGEPLMPSDLAVLSPDHVEHLILCQLQQNGAYVRVGLEGTQEEAGRALAALYPKIAQAYAAPEAREKACLRFLQFFGCYEETPPRELRPIAQVITQRIIAGMGITTDVLGMAQAVLGSPDNPYAIDDLIRGLGDLSNEEQKHFPEVLEWIAVAERMSHFQTLRDAQDYRYALMELETRTQDLPEPTRASAGRMVPHVTVLLKVLTGQDQPIVPPPPLAAFYASCLSEELQAYVEGGGGEFGLARIPWMEQPEEHVWHRMREFTGLRIAFPRDLKRVSGALLRILSQYVAPADAGIPQELGQREIAEDLGLDMTLLEGLDGSETRDVLAFVQGVIFAQRQGVLGIYGPKGVTLDEAREYHRRASATKLDEP